MLALTVIGAGPVGLMAAIHARRLGTRVELWADRLPSLDDPWRVECVPAQTIALLIEIGVPPAAIGVDALFETRHTQWGGDRPACVPTRREAHVSRPALECCLLQIAQRCGVEFLARSPLPPLRSGRTPLTLSDAVFDATGRAALTSSRRVRPPKPLISRVFNAAGCFPAERQALAIAAGPEGYVYRLGNTNGLSFGIVGSGDFVRGDWPDVAGRVRGFAPWILSSLHSANIATGQSGAASFQWAIASGRAMLLGDAAFARDAMSSQGLAAGLVHAVHAVSMRVSNSAPGPPQDFRALRDSHKRMIDKLIESSPFNQAEAWVGYRQFLLKPR